MVPNYLLVQLNTMVVAVDTSFCSCKYYLTSACSASVAASAAARVSLSAAASVAAEALACFRAPSSVRACEGTQSSAKRAAG